MNNLISFCYKTSHVDKQSVTGYTGSHKVMILMAINIQFFSCNLQSTRRGVSQQFKTQYRSSSLWWHWCTTTIKTPASEGKYYRKKPRVGPLHLPVPARFLKQGLQYNRLHMLDYYTAPWSLPLWDKPPAPHTDSATQLNEGSNNFHNENAEMQHRVIE